MDTATALEMSYVEEEGPRSSQQPQAGQMSTNFRPEHLGDSSSLYYTVEVDYSPEGGSTEPLRVHYPIPASITNRTGPHPENLVEEPVSLHEALEMPSQEIADQLIHTFFTIIHPAFPVFDRKTFATLYSRGQASPLLLHNIFFLGFTTGSETLVQEAGYRDRATARRIHYLRAKALYDADYDKDRANVVACLLLMGFWWAGYEDQKDTCYWVGCATNVALSMGMHRSMSKSGMSPPMRSLWKRIWWSIYVRDRHTAAAFGRPCLIQDEDCDVESVTEEDLRFDECYDQSLIPPQADYHISYFLEMTKLTVILGDILKAEFSPRRPAIRRFETEALAERLTHWESQLPGQLQKMPLDGSLGAPFWTAMLQFSYKNYHILLFRPKAIETLSSTETDRDLKARMAADSITRLAEDLLAIGTIRSAQIHLVPALFGALSINTIAICRKDPIRRQLAQNKSRQCILALSELAKSWPVRIWILKAFVNLMRRLTGLSSGTGGSITNVSSNIGSNRDNMAPQGNVSLDSPRHPTNCPSLHFVNGNQTQSHRSERRETSVQTTLTNGLEAGDLHADSDLSQLFDQFMNDSSWAGCLDQTFNSDILLQKSTGPPFYMPIEYLTGTGNPDAPSF